MLNDLEKIKESLEGVIRVADRKTIEFDAAKESVKALNSLIKRLQSEKGKKETP